MGGPRNLTKTKGAHLPLPRSPRDWHLRQEALGRKSAPSAGARASVRLGCRPQRLFRGPTPVPHPRTPPPHVIPALGGSVGGAREHRWTDMSQEGSPEDPALSPRCIAALFQDDVEEASSGSGLTPHRPGASSGARVGAGSRKRVLREETRRGADVGSLGDLYGPLSPNDTGPGSGDPGGTCVGCVSGTAKFEYLPASENGAQPGSPSHPVGVLPPDGGESLRPAVWDPGSALGLGASGKASTVWQEAEHLVGAGCDDGPAVSHSQEELEVKAQPESRGRLGEGPPAPTDRPSSSLEPTTSRAHSGPSMGQRRSKYAKKSRRGPVPHAQHQGADRSADDFSKDQQDKSHPGSFPKLEEMEMPHGVKHVCYLGSGAVLHLLGALRRGQAGELQPPKLEVLEDMMESAEAEEEEPGEQDGGEDSEGWGC
ncbi:SPOC domain-containing protein 1-like [Neovison vison]|uniref:SPOC domain-containing protein 1-like n=1 Tax=Neovison vison TaxID=452646 RepID=UPI001CF00146|nr:SPOC domain-containing protein 1-like [Neogale vison]